MCSTPTTSVPVPDLTVKEFAFQTHTQVQVIYRLCRRGVVPSYKVGGAVRIPAEAVEALRSTGLPPREVYLAELLAKAPPLTPEQIDRLSALLDWDPPPGEQKQRRQPRRRAGTA
jgi:excisionase family DNA binding protein